ncbi:hypothetical protein WAI453_001977 [Rhynchosporium graminicola]
MGESGDTLYRSDTQLFDPKKLFLSINLPSYGSHPSQQETTNQRRDQGRHDIQQNLRSWRRGDRPGKHLALIEGKRLSDYVPSVLEGLLKLSLGKDECVAYVQDQRRDYIFSAKLKNLDLDVAKAWKMFGADMKNAANI